MSSDAPDAPVLSAALALLRKRDRFEAELRAMLLSKGHSESSLESALAWLRAKDVLNDRRAVESAVARSEGRSAKGCEALRDALVAREAPPALIDEALAALEPEPIRARRALEAAPSSTRAKRTRADRYLASRAFDGESISSALEAMGLGSATES